MANLSEQLKIQQEINSIIKKRSAMLKEQASQLTGQAKLAKQLCKALDCKDLDDMEDRLKGINDELKEAAKNAQATEEEIEGMGNAAADAESKAGGLTGKLAGIGGAIGGVSGMMTAFKGFVGVLKGAASLIGSVVSGIFSIGKAILSIPFGIYQGLLGMAQGGGGGPSPIKVQLEEIRDAVGSLATNEGKALRDSMMGAKQSFKELGVEGVSFARIFGVGPGGVAEAGKALMEIAGALGSNLDMLTNMTKKQQFAMAIYQRGLGLTAAQMRGVADLARAAGMGMDEYATKVASYAINMGKQFGINAKLISKDMGAMMEDFANFGRLGPKVMSSIAVFTRKLGFEAKELTGIIDKFDNFEDAAQSASKLNQVFGIQIDAMKQMREQDPAKRLANLQQAFAATGKSVEAMSRQELKLLASTSGLSEKAAALAFSQKGLGMSYEDVMSGADEAEGKQLSQAEAMKELSDSIKKTFGGGGGSQFKGFFDAFVKGFGKGIRRSKEFRKIMRNIRKSLRIIYKAGKRVGKAFVELFPGVKKTFKGIGELFSPKKFRKLGNGLVKVFTDMFKRVRTDPKGGVRQFIKDIKNLFGRFFDSQGPAIKMIKDGATRFFKTFSLIVAEAIRALKPYIISGLDSITEFIKDPSGFMDAAENAGSFIAEIFNPIIDALLENEDGEGGITGAFKRLFTTLWEKIGGPTMDAIKKFGETFLKRAIMFVIAKTLLGAATGALVGGISKMMKNIGSATPQNLGTGDKFTIQAQKGFVEQLSALAQMDIGTIAKAGFALAALGAGFAAGFLAFGVAFKLVMMMLGNEDPIKMAVVGAISVAMAKAAANLGHAAADISRVEKFDGTRVAIVLAASAIIVPALGYLGSILAEAYGDVTIGQIGKALAMTGGLTVLTLMVAAASTGIAKSGAAAGTMEMSATVLAKAGLMVTAIGFLGSLVARAYSGIDPGQVKMATELTTVLVALTVGVSLGALAIGAIMVKTLGIGLAVIGVGLKTLAIVGAGIAAFSAGFVIAFRTFSKSDLEKASIAGDVAIKVTKAASMGLAAAMKAGMTAALAAIFSFMGGGNPIDEGLRAMEEFFKLFKQYIPGIIADLLAAVKNVSPEEVKHAMQLLEGLMKAMDPLINLQQAVVSLAAGLAGGGMDSKQIQDTFKKMTEFMSAPMEEVTKLVGVVEKTAENLGKNEAALKGAQAVASILSAAASFMNAMIGPIVKLMEVSVDEKIKHNMIAANDKYKQFNATKFKSAMGALKDNMPDIIASMGTGIETVVDKIAEISFTEAQKARLEEFSKIIGPLAKTILALMNAFTGFMDMGGDVIKGTQHVIKGSSMAEVFVDSVHQLTKNVVFIFTGRSLTGGKYGDREGLFKAVEIIVGAMADFKFPEKSKLDKVILVMEAAEKITQVMTKMIKMMSGAGGKIPKDAQTDVAKRGEYYTELNTFVGAILTTMTTKMGEFLGAMIRQTDALIDKDASAAKIKRTHNRVKIMLDMFKTIQPIVDLISNMMAIFKDDPAPPKQSIPGKETAISFKEFSGKAKDFIGDMIDALTHPEKGMSKLFDMFAGKGEQAGLIERLGNLYRKVGYKKVTSRIKVFGEMMGMMKQVSGVISALGPMMMKKVKTGAMTQVVTQEGTLNQPTEFKLVPEELSEIEVVLKKIPEVFGANGEKVLPIVNAMKGIMPALKGVPVVKDAAVRISGFEKVVELLGNETIQSLTQGKLTLGVFDTTTDFSTLGTLVGQANVIARKINGSTLAKDGLETQVTNAANTVAAIGTLLTAASSPVEVQSVWKTGKLVIQHQIPQGINANIKIQVNLDKTALAKELVSTKIDAKSTGIKTEKKTGK